MEHFFETIRLLILCGSLLAFGMLILLSLPQSRLRDIVMQIFGWCFAIFCGLYCISPIDIFPEVFLGPVGFIDDLGAVITGFSSASAAVQARRRLTA